MHLFKSNLPQCLKYQSKKNINTQTQRHKPLKQKTTLGVHNKPVSFKRRTRKKKHTQPKEATRNRNSNNKKNIYNIR